MKTRSGEWVMALVMGGSLLFLLLTAAFRVEDWRDGNPNAADIGIAESKTTTQIGMGFTGVRVDRLDAPEDSTLVPGMSGYLLPFVIVSVHLLVVLVGAAYMARTKRQATSTGAAA